ncbi:MAG: hypothetical protein J6126_01090 [Clostridia bacterium]|nr:hypothetical protein [Clostridia bacterium]
MEKASGKTAYKSGGVFTRETIGMTLILFSVLSIVLLLLSDVLFSTQWFYTRFLYGSFGYFSFALFASLTVIGGRMLADKRRRAEFRQALFVILFAIFAVGLVHVVTAPLAPGSYGNYISDCYAKGSEGISTSTGGGAVFAAIVYPALKFITPIGCYILFSVLAVASVFAYFRATVKSEVRKTEKKYGKNKAEYSGFKPYPEGEFDFPEFSVRSSQLSTYSDKTSKGVTLFNNNGSGEFAHISRKERKSDEYRAFNIIDPIAKPKENEESTRKEYSRFNTEIFPTASYQSQTSGEILGRTNVVRTPYSFDEEEESSFEPNTRAVDSVLGENIVRRNPEEIRTVVDESTPFARVTPVQEGRTERSISAKKPES